MARIISRSIQNYALRRVFPLINRRLVSTSKKNNETATADVCTPPAKTTTGPTTAVQENWISYGYDYKSKADDRSALHSVMFASITLCIVVGGFFMAYLPDYNLRDWAQREAFLELRRREQNCLPLVDPNYIDPAKIALPSDEDLGNTNIII